MEKPFDSIPKELQNKSTDYIETIIKFNQELKDLKIPIQFQMTITKHRKSDWNEDENYYWRDTVKLFNNFTMLDSNNFI